jgi:hypothetical protein
MLREWIYSRVSLICSHTSPETREVLYFLCNMDWFDWTVAIVGTFFALIAALALMGEAEKGGW